MRPRGAMVARRTLAPPQAQFCMHAAAARSEGKDDDSSSDSSSDSDEEPCEIDDFLEAEVLMEGVPSLQETWRPKMDWYEYDDSKLRVSLAIADLKLSEVEQAFLEAIAGPRVKDGTLTVVTREEGGYEPNRNRMLEILDQLQEESKKLAVAHPNG